jgi:hypothetical protein
MMTSRFLIPESSPEYPALGYCTNKKYRIVLDRGDNSYVLQRFQSPKWRHLKYFTSYENLTTFLCNKGYVFGVIHPYYYEKHNMLKEYYWWRIPKHTRLKKATPDFLRGKNEEILRINGIYRLRDIMIRYTGIPYHVDHMWPIADGGPHWSGNLQILTATDNIRKHAKVCTVIKSEIKQMLEEERSRYEHS